MNAPAPHTRQIAKDQFFLGARACIPVAISVSAYGLVWGVLAKGAGLTVLEVILMSGLVFAGSAQFVALELWTATPSALPIGALIIAALIVNLRYMLLTATLRPLFAPDQMTGGFWRMFLVTDENWAMTVAEMARGGGSRAFLLGGGVLAYCCWMVSTLTGRMLGAVIDDPSRYGLDFAFTATFLALLLGMWRGKADLIPWLVAAVTAIICAKLLPGSWYILIGGITGSLAGAAIETFVGGRRAELA
ncbi:AzlC family ABC transporter permease [Devosia rhodophyticola]|uniref:AzlC family ABC transporter permease n=1 Tax=Devosia rhodophyticola TaxID=3026423 RepID=A0ABY7YTJ2_9HYPH|nr:AzlC family ABC transporter permease [Devosia rhodophyticola]WDR04658.1 AzlC family ABC transporter permease [Devosia rhodophyticola]